MLDLTARTKTKKLYELKMPDGQLLTLKLPTQALLMKLQAIQEKNDNPIEALAAVNDVITSILNLNTQGIKYTEEQVRETLDLDMIVLVVQDYLTETTKTLGE